MRKALCLLLLLPVLFLAACTNVNPNMPKDGTDEPGTSTDPSSLPAYLDPDALAIRSYELRYLLAQEKFDSPDEISVNALVQYAFCHIYYENLTDMPRSGNRLRQASADEIKQEILKYFGAVSTDITKADLYNSGKQYFEMWEPLYGRDIFYTVSASRDGTDRYKIQTVFYTDASKQDSFGKTVLTVEDAAGKILIQKLVSSK